MTRIALVAASLSFALFACRGDDDPNPGTDGGSGSGDGPPPAGSVTIQEVQSDAMPDGTSIELEGVIVTAIDSFGNRTGDIWVSEPDGGPFSGVKVFGASLDQVATLELGDLINITGAIKREGCTEAHPCGPVIFDDGASITEVMGASQGSLVITKVGTMPLPTPAVVDAKAIAALPTADARKAEWEKWEGVLIKVTNARQLADVRPFGTNPGPDSTEFRITGVARVQSILVELPTTAVVGTCYDSITGVGDFFFNYIIAPRSAADLVGAGTGCNPMAESISAFQSAATPPELVRLTNVYVTAVSSNKKNLWVSTSPTAAPNEGVFVFRCASMGCNTTSELPATVVVGRKVTVLGEGLEFPGTDNTGPTLTQVGSPTITPSADAPSTIVAVQNPPSIAMLQAAATGEPYEGVLVRLQNVKLTTLGTSSNSFTATFTSAGTTFKADDELYRFTANMNTCYSSMLGVWTYNVFTDEYMFQPRASAADAAQPDGMVAGNQAACD